ncbi:MAG: phosphatase PAP2 family protein [Ilumatobacteraceae bacterium]
MSAPGQYRFGPAIAHFDATVDRALERVRGNELVDRVMVVATDAGEFSAIWHLSSLARGVVTGRTDQVLALAIGIGTESLIVNQGLKRAFHRPRPTTSGDERFDIRTPITSSFPSGHASAATFAAVTLIGWDGPRSIPLWGTMAAVVAISRPYVRIHHGSDIVGGVVAGATMGWAARRIFRRLGLS